MLLNLDEFVGSIDQENLRIVVEELGRAFEGAGDDLGRLIDNGDLLLARAEQSLPQTLRLITDGQTVLDTQNDEPHGDPRSGRRTCGCSPTRSSTWIPTCAASWSTRPTPARRSRAWSRTPVPGLGSLVRNLDILNGVQIPRLDGIQADADHLSRRRHRRVHRRPAESTRTGVLRSHFGFVLNAGEPHSCTTGYVASVDDAAARARSRTSTPTPSSAAVVNGVDPDPGDGYDENGSNIRGEQNIGRDGGRGATAPQEQAGRRQPADRRRSPSCWAGCSTPTRSPRSRADLGMPPTHTSHGQGESPRVTSEARARPRDEEEARGLRADTAEPEAAAHRCPERPGTAS